MGSGKVHVHTQVVQKSEIKSKLKIRKIASLPSGKKRNTTMQWHRLFKLLYAHYQLMSKLKIAVHDGRSLPTFQADCCERKCSQDQYAVTVFQM